MEQAFGKYVLLRKLATGGMAEVWLARQTGIERFEKKLVIKRILPRFAADSEFKEMFLNEARIAAQFSHPNVVQIYDLGEVGGIYYIAMEYVHGQDLGRIVRQARSVQQTIPQHIAIKIIALACEGLYYAHTRTDDAGQPLKVIHRDISPQNILVGFDGSVKLVDFGIAKAVNSAAMTRAGSIKGKLSYMPPEQASTKNIDHRVDLFAIGLTLYEVLSDTRPLKKKTDAATFMAALECNIPPLAQVARVPPELEPIVMRAIAKNRDDRYQDARQFGVALETFLVAQQKMAGPVQISEVMNALYVERPADWIPMTPAPPAPVPRAPAPTIAVPAPASPATPIVPMPAFRPPPPRELEHSASSEVQLAGGTETWAPPGTPVGTGGRYILGNKVGAGVISEVYLCSAHGPAGSASTLALKKLRREVEGDANLVEAFLHEALRAGTLRHRHVVRIHGVDQHGGTPFYVMEYVRGRSLRDVLQRSKELQRPLPPMLVARIGAAAAQGLSFAHQARDSSGRPLSIIHGNMSPANVLLSYEGSVKLMDFGLGMSFPLSTTAFTPSRFALNGKLAYLSPEQVRGGLIDGRADQFSLGVVLWESLTGKRLFDADSPAEVLGAVESRVVTPPALVNRDVPEELSELVMATLEREPFQRFRTADQMCRALGNVVAHHSTSPEQTDLAHYLQALYGDGVAQAAERDPHEVETATAISTDELTSSMRRGDANDDTAVVAKME